MFVFSARNVFRLLDFKQSSRPTVLDLLGSVRDPDRRLDVESVQQGRSTGLVAAVDADPIGQLHYRDRHAFPAIYILANTWIRQRPIPRRTAVDTDNSLILLRPVWPAFFVKRRDAFARFRGFARLQVML